MRRRTKIAVNPRYMLMALGFVCIILILISFKFQDKMAPIKTAVGNVVTPMQKGINSVGRKIAEKIELFNNIQDLTKENKELKEQLDTISYENKILQQEKYELDGLRDLYDLDKQYPSYPKVAARVIAGDPDNWFNTFTIDKGSEEGLKKDMNVLAGEGLVGIVSEVGKHYARVRSIIDDNSSVMGSFLKTSDTCMVSGNLQLMDSGYVDVVDISNDAKIEDGYEVVTSSISSKFLEGILIGYIKDIETDASNMTKSGHLTPAVDFQSLDTVLVITEVKDSSEMEDFIE